MFKLSLYKVRFCRDSHGFTGADIETLCKKAALLHAAGRPDALAQARRLSQPTGIRQFILEVPNVSWDEIGGNEALKQEIQQVSGRGFRAVNHLLASPEDWNERGTEISFLMCTFGG